VGGRRAKRAVAPQASSFGKRRLEIESTF